MAAASAAKSHASTDRRRTPPPGAVAAAAAADAKSTARRLTPPHAPLIDPNSAAAAAPAVKQHVTVFHDALGNALAALTHDVTSELTGRKTQDPNDALTREQVRALCAYGVFGDPHIVSACEAAATGPNQALGYGHVISELKFAANAHLKSIHPARVLQHLTHRWTDSSNDDGRRLVEPRTARVLLRGLMRSGLLRPLLPECVDRLNECTPFLHVTCAGPKELAVDMLQWISPSHADTDQPAAGAAGAGAGAAAQAVTASAARRQSKSWLDATFSLAPPDTLHVRTAAELGVNANVDGASTPLQSALKTAWSFPEHVAPVDRDALMENDSARATERLSVVSMLLPYADDTHCNTAHIDLPPLLMCAQRMCRMGPDTDQKQQQPQEGQNARIRNTCVGIVGMRAFEILLDSARPDACGIDLDVRDGDGWTVRLVIGCCVNGPLRWRATEMYDKAVARVNAAADALNAHVTNVLLQPDSSRMLHSAKGVVALCLRYLIRRPHGHPVDVLAAAPAPATAAKPRAKA